MTLRADSPFNSSRWLAASLLAASMLVGGCSTRVVNFPAEFNAARTEARAVRAEGRRHVVVAPLKDARPEKRSNLHGHAIPILGLGLMFVPDRHPRPEATADFGAVAFEGTMGDALRRAVAARLTESRAFASADVADPRDPAVDARRYDFILEGTITRAELRVRHYDYGLNLFGFDALSYLPQALGAPDEGMATDLQVDWRLIERPSGRVIWQHTDRYPAAKATRGLWWGRKHLGGEPQATLFAESFAEGAGVTVERLAKALRDDVAPR